MLYPPELRAHRTKIPRKGRDAITAGLRYTLSRIPRKAARSAGRPPIEETVRAWPRIARPASPVLAPHGAPARVCRVHPRRGSPKPNASSKNSVRSPPGRIAPLRRASLRSPPTNGGSVPSETPGTANRVLALCRLLNRHRARYLLAGGVAANLHGSVRATRDVDILVPPDVGNTRRLLTALSELPFGVAAELDAEHVANRPVTIVGDDPRVDILTVAWSVRFDDAWPRRVARRIQGVRVPYLGLEDLMASKRTGRATDRADLEVLRGLRPRPRRRPARR